MRLPRHVLRVEGPDAATLLDGLLTQRISAPAPGGASLYAGLLTPQGKLTADFLLHPTEQGFLLDVAESRSADVLKRLKLYKLRADVQIEDASGRWAVVAGVGAPDPRLSALGLRGLMPVETAPAFAAAEFAAYEAMRIRLGAPDPAIDAAPEEPFALEALLEELHGVDFHKGCFVGQENVSRMKRRATTRRKFCRVTFDGPAPAFGAPVTAGAAVLGDIRSGVDGCAIALMRLDRAQEALNSGQSLDAGGLPLRLDPPAWLFLPATDTTEG